MIIARRVYPLSVSNESNSLAKIKERTELLSKNLPLNRDIISSLNKWNQGALVRYWPYKDDENTIVLSIIRIVAKYPGTISLSAFMN